MNLIKKLFNRFFSKANSYDKDIQELVSKGMTIGENCHFYSSENFDHIYPHLISFGDNVTVSTNVTILAHDASTNVVKCGTKLGCVTIGNNVFIGTGSTILCNTKIGNNVVIGAATLVNRDLPDDGVYAGVPARRICSIQEYEEKTKTLRKTKPDISQIKPWYEWYDATPEERAQMKAALTDQIGFI